MSGLRNSRNWTISLPTGFGPYDGFADLSCGDLDSAKDSMRMLPGSVYGRDVAVSGRNHELARVTDESQAGSIALSCTEEAADALDMMREIGCPFPIQRRACRPSPTRPENVIYADTFYLALDAVTRYEHYAAVQLGERSLDRPTARGIEKSDGTPMVSMPGVFSRRFQLTDKLPGDYDWGEFVPMGIVYCYNPLCGDCGKPCDKMYSLVREQIDGLTTEMKLYSSVDGGNAWANIANIPEIRGEFAFIFCYQGSRLFIGEINGQVYYSDNPEGEEWYDLISLNNLLDNSWASKMVSDGYAIFAIVGDANQTGVVRSVDMGITWEYVMPLDNLTTGQIRDIAVDGNVVATYGETAGGVAQVLYSYNFGDWQTWTSYTNVAMPENGAIGVANPNPFDENRAWFYIIGIDTGNNVEIWKADDPEDWAKIYEVDFDVLETWQFCQIFLDGDGYIGWFHACQVDGDTLTLRTSDGGKTWVNVSLRQTSTDETDGRAILAVCPHNPDEGFVIWHSENPVIEI